MLVNRRYCPLEGTLGVSVESHEPKVEKREERKETRNLKLKIKLSMSGRAESRPR